MKNHNNIIARLLQLYIPVSFMLSFVFLSSCAGPGAADNGKLRIVCTTGMIADAARNITKGDAVVQALMGPGVDPHLYKATQGDLQKLNDADIIIYNGLHLEGKMAEILEKLANKKKVIAVSDGIPKNELISNDAFAGAFDPHIWFDVNLWSKGLKFMTDKLGEYVPEHKTHFDSNSKIYLHTLDSLHSWVKTEIATIPRERRVLITAHDAFSYFGRAYEIDVRGLQGISTVSEFGLKDVTELVNFISRNKIKAVFVESSVPRKSLETVVEGCRQSGHEVKIGGTLFSDAMGADGSPEGTYPGMVTANARTIAGALK